LLEFELIIRSEEVTWLPSSDTGELNSMLAGEITAAVRGSGSIEDAGAEEDRENRPMAFSEGRGDDLGDTELPDASFH